MRACGAFACAVTGQADEALLWLATIIDAIERSPGWATNYTTMICLSAGALWFADRTDHASTIERNLTAKTLAADFRYPMVDARQSMARLCALQGRHEQAAEWFAKARDVLDEQRARPLRAVVDYDEALMFVRRGRRGDRNRALPLLDAALTQFRALDMPGWIERGKRLRRSLTEATGQSLYPDRLTSREVDVLRLIAAGRTNTEVASDLTLSVRTVGRHITNIYGKTGIRNRAEAARYATERGLN
jgi:ATP/maltotriose-dependent transcriptional regulator MalT